MSTKRVNAFLQLEELDLIDYYGKRLNCTRDESEDNNDESRDANVRSSIHDATAISIHHGSFTWTNTSSCSNRNNSQTTSSDGDSTPTVPWNLKDVNISIKPVSFFNM